MSSQYPTPSLCGLVSCREWRREGGKEERGREGGEREEHTIQIQLLINLLSRIRTAIVALPIAIVTSYVLYQRIFKGEERKKFSDAVPSV